MEENCEAALPGLDKMHFVVEISNSQHCIVLVS